MFSLTTNLRVSKQELKAIFDEIDKNGNDSVSKTELVKMLKSNERAAALFDLPRLTSKGHKLDQLLASIFQTIDVNNDRSITFDEFLRVFDKCTGYHDEKDREKDARARAHEEFNEQRAAQIKEYDARAMREEQVRKSQRRETDKAKRAIEIQYQTDELKANIRGCGSSHTVRRIQNEFRNWDKDSSGSISVEEFEAVLKKVGMNVSTKDVRKLFKAADTNSDGVVDHQEFTAWILRD
eukprot:TRINITY_DN54674_c0_g1_i1.p1 TRINITY_DN54674_c0_g1~~TRINITY_DN54674_c0_g1_i1.p1  ORF type:complete len:238 (-),score=51.39 TRINITY_DN54674_c0_g1_i1:99-812(-)